MQSLFKKTPVAVQMLLMMEQYIRDNSSKIIEISPDEENILNKEYTKLCNLGLSNTKNARIVADKLRDLINLRQSKEKAIELLNFIKSLRECFGESTILIGTDQFNSILSKYNLSVGLLSQYTGIIPNKNISEIEAVSSRIDYFPYTINSNNSGNTLWKITKVMYGFSQHSIITTIEKWLKSKNNFVYSNYPELHYDRTIWLKDLVDCNLDIPEEIRNFPYHNLVNFEGIEITKKHFLIACPKEQLKEQSIEITKEIVDPIVFQYSPYGIIIHSIWGEEAEDKVFEEYRKINNLLSI